MLGGPLLLLPPFSLLKDAIGGVCDQSKRNRKKDLYDYEDQCAGSLFINLSRLVCPETVALTATALPGSGSGWSLKKSLLDIKRRCWNEQFLRE